MLPGSYSEDERRCHRCGTNDEQPNSADRATQPMEAGGWVSQLYPNHYWFKPEKLLSNNSLDVQGNTVCCALWLPQDPGGHHPSRLYLVHTVVKRSEAKPHLKPSCLHRPMVGAGILCLQICQPVRGTQDSFKKTHILLKEPLWFLPSESMQIHLKSLQGHIRF